MVAESEGVRPLRRQRPNRSRLDADVFVTHYDIVHAWVDAVLEWSIDKEAEYEDRNSDRRLRRGASAAQSRHPPLEGMSCHHAEVARGRMAHGHATGRESQRSLQRRRHDQPRAIRRILRIRKTLLAMPSRRRSKAPRRRESSSGISQACSNTKELQATARIGSLSDVTKREVLKELPALQRQIVDV